MDDAHPVTSPAPSVLGVAAAALLVAALGAWLVPRLTGAAPAAHEPTAAAPLADEVLRLETIGPREAWVWHGDFRLGRLHVAADEHVTGDALVQFPRRVRRFGTRSVAVVKPDDLEQVVAEKVRNMCLGLGVLDTRIVPAGELP